MTTAKGAERQAIQKRLAKTIYDSVVSLTFRGEKHRDLSLEFYDDETQKVITETACNIFKRGGPGVFFRGEYGVGKTAACTLIWRHYWKLAAWQSAAIALANARTYGDDDLEEGARERALSGRYILASYPVVFRTHMELITELRETADNRNVQRDSMLWHKAPLIVDDFMRGQDDQHQWNAVLQFELFDYRWRFNLPTIISTNKTKEYLRDVKDNWAAIIDRMADKSWMVTYNIAGESARRRREDPS